MSQRIFLDGIPIDALMLDGFLERIRRSIADGCGGFIVTPNLDHLYRARHDPAWRSLLTGADIAVADGVPLLWAARVAGTPLPGRLAGSDLISVLARTAAAEGWRVQLVGGAGDSAAGAASEMRSRHPGIVLSGCESPVVGSDGMPADPRLLDRLVEARPQLVLVGLGSPKQEMFIAHARQAWPNAWYIGIGVGFSFLSGDLRRAPRWMQRCGLEWTWRLAQEPRRLAGRYLRRNLPYAFVLMAVSLRSRFSRAR